MFNPQTYENSRPDGIGVLEVVDGQKSDQHRRFVPLKRTELHGEVLGPLAAMRLVQTYGYTRQQCDQVLEAFYRFPMPGDAAVTAVSVHFGTVEIRAELKPREQAEADYKQAKLEGRQAALATRESPDVFTLQIAGLQPDQEIMVETRYVQLARAEGGGWSLRVPLTTAPRYLRSDERTSRHAQGQPLALLRDPGHRFSLDVILRGIAAVESPTHRLEVQRTEQDLRVRLQAGAVIPDRDCVLVWKPAQQPDQPTLQVLLHDDRASGHVYFLALVAPSATHDRGQGIPREVVLLVDHSGSMQGAKWQAADWAVERFLTELTERDTFDLGLFHNTTTWFSKKPSRADGSAIAKGIEFLKTHRDRGGTELGVALEQALGLSRTAGDLARHVLIITDAEVSDSGRILRLADEETKRPDHRRVSVLCIDAAPNSLLASELAERGGGVARFLTSDPDQEDIATSLDEVLADWSEPVLTGLRLEVNCPQVEAAGRNVLETSESGWSAVDLGDLPAGRPLWVAGRVPRGDAKGLVFRAMTSMTREIARYAANLQQAAEPHPALKALFGARRVLGLESLIHAGHRQDELPEELRRLGYDPKVVLAAQPPKPAKVYAENARDEANAALRELLVHEALDYGLASSETAFVAVRTEAGKPVEGTVVVANALPSGWSGDFLIGGAASGMLLCSLSAPADALFAAAPPTFGGRGNSPMRFSRLLSSQPTAASSSATEPETESPPALFSGIPEFLNGEAILFDSSRSQDAGKLPDEATIGRLEVRFAGTSPAPDTLPPGLCLLIFVDDLATPRARVRLADIRKRTPLPFGN